METCHSLIAVLLMLERSLSVTTRQAIEVQRKLTGYLGYDVVLPCQLSPRCVPRNVTQVEWEKTGNGTNKFILNPQFGLSIQSATLQERVAFSNTSLCEFTMTIRDVRMSDAGVYICSMTTFPAGAFKGTTNLTISDFSVSPWEIAGIVMAVFLVLAVIATSAYLLVVRRRHEAFLNNRVNVGIDRQGTAGDRPSVVLKEEDLVYSGIPTFIATRSQKKGRPDPPRGGQRVDDVTYSEVRRPNPKRDDAVVYSSVVRK